MCCTFVVLVQGMLVVWQAGWYMSAVLLVVGSLDDVDGETVALE